MKIVFMERMSLGEDVSLEKFDELGEVIVYDSGNDEENASRIKDAEIVISNKILMNEQLLQDCKKLKLICLTATGTNNVDFDYVNKKGIKVANVKGYSTESVAQHTFAMLFYLYEQLAKYDEYVKSGEYARASMFSFFDYRFHELCDKTWGIIGLGNIGRRVAEIAKAFGCKIVYYSTSGQNSSNEYERVELDELLKRSDIVSIHSPLNSNTEDLISDKELKLMKKTSVLLNLGRGRIVNEYALYNALVNNEIAAAGLDVLSIEPIKADNPLIKIKDSSKLFITPHIGWGTIEARQRCADEVAENIKAFLRGDSRNIVNS